MFAAARPICRLARGVATSAVKREVHPGYKMLDTKKKLFNADNNVPVYIKGGAMDQVLYRLTMGLCVAAVILDFKLYFDLS